MADDRNAPDETAIPAVSSLRSKFETLISRPAAAAAGPPASTSASSNGPVYGGPPAIPKKPSLHSNPRPKSMLDPYVEQGLQPAADFASIRSSFESRRPAVVNSSDEQVPLSVKSRPQVPQKKPALASRFGEVAENGMPKSREVGKGDQEAELTPLQTTSARRGRNASDASWVERLRADSDASSHAASPIIPRRLSPKKMTRSSRVDSNASWVEVSDFGNVPATGREHEHFDGAKELNDFGSEESVPTLPPRQPTQVDVEKVRRTSSDIGDAPPEHSTSLPETRPALPTRPLAPSRPAHMHAQTLDIARNVYNSNLSSAASSTGSLNAPPAVPPSRRSLDRRREFSSEKPPLDDSKPVAKTSLDFGSTRHVSSQQSSTKTIARTEPDVSPDNGHLSTRTFANTTRHLDTSPPSENGNVAFPDVSKFNRRPPTWRSRPSQINTEYDTRLLALGGDFVCTSGHVTRIWDVRTGELLVTVSHSEGVKATAVCFLPTPPGDGEHSVWIGMNTGDLHEVNTSAQCIVDTSQRAHKGREIIRIHKDRHGMWTLDEAGNLAVWSGSRDRNPNLGSQFQLFRTQRSVSASLVCDNKLWLASGKEIKVYQPAAKSDSEFVVNQISLLNIGDVTTMTALHDVLYIGHTDGKISLLGRRSCMLMSVVHISMNKIALLGSVGSFLWTAFSSGVVQVHDISTNPWTTKKEWQAHAKTVTGIAHGVDSRDASPLKVVTLGADNVIKIWDGLFEDDWIEERLQQLDSTYCDFHEISVSILTWNAGATKPAHLQNRIEDDSFLRDYISENSRSDIFVFGFQELVDLEDKKLTAKSFFKSRKKDAFEQESMTHRYRAWQDHLNIRMKEYSSHEMVNLHTASMIGLFTCIFVKASLRSRIKHIHQAEVKRGMGGLYGNKGALILRLVLDDSSMCFINCHLAAGQTQTATRNSDAAAILDAECLPAWPLDRRSEKEHGDVFPFGGDGSTVLDHELCILNGDLNYRIDTMSRDLVVRNVDQGNLTKLLERDQLLLSRKKNPGFKLRAFQEGQIEFDPTYKYNVQSNEYDTSEKRRSPAWCDRVLFRGLGKIRCHAYRRWEVRVSDHRPVSALLTCQIKTVDPERRAQASERCVKEFLAYKRRAGNASLAGP